MNTKRIFSVIRREIKVSMGIGFIAATILIPLVMFAIVGIQVLVADIKTDAESPVTVLLDPNAPFESILRDEIGKSKELTESKVKVDYATGSGNGATEFLDSKREELLGNDNMGIIYIPNTAAQDKQVSFYSANPANAHVRLKMETVINKALNQYYFTSNGIQNIDIAQIQRAVTMTGNKVSKSGTEAESWGPLIVGGTLALMLLFGVSFNSMPVMTMVVTEKASRVYEVLLGSLTPLELLWGKIIGKTLVATLQMLIWVVAMAIVLMLLNNFVDVADAFRMDINIAVFAYYVVNYVIGLMTFLTLYAGFAVSYDDSGKASSALLPVYFAILFPFYTFFSLLGNPANGVSEVLSIMPLTSLYVMPARMALINVPAWQPILALVLNVAVLYLAIVAASRLYRLSILTTGNNPSLRQLVLWAKKAG